MRTSKLLRGVQPVKTRCTCDPSVKHRRDSSSDVDDDDDDANGFSFYGDLCPQCTIVQNELRAVEEKAKTAKGTGKRGEGPAREPVGESGTAARKVRTTGTSRVLDNELMSGAPFLPPERHSMLKDALRMQEAAKWLAICPRGTLRVLQQRVLCATAEHFISFAGMPSHIAELIEANGGTVPGKKPAGSDDDIDSVIQPPPPLSFTSFMSDFLALNVDVERVTPVEVSKTKNIDGADVITSLYIRGLLQTGRALPVAPLSSVNLFYSSLPAEEALAHTVVTVVENHESQLNSTRGTDTARKYKKNVERKVSPFTYIERDQALLSDVVHWATFFATFFDEARESQCREPMSLFCSILLACAIAGRAELNETPEAVMEHTTAQLRREDPSYTHCATCTACMHRQLWVKEQCHFQVLAGMPTHNDYVRFFLGTPAVVLWVESFLQLYRVGQVMRRKRRTSSGELTNGLDEPDDDIRPGEAYLVRDWIAAESRCDAEGFSRQKVNGYFCVPLSSEAGRNKVVKVGFSSNSVDLVVEKVSSWVDSGVKHGHPLKVSALLQLLREGFPVLPYYMTFFAPERRS